MKRQMLLFALFLAGGMFATQAQSKQDSLFLKSMVTNKNLVEGKSYLFETEEQHTSPEYGKSMLLHEKDTPKYDYRGLVANGIPYAEFGNSPLVYKGAKTDKIEIEKETVQCLVLLFTCNGKKYKIIELPSAERRPRAYYNLIEADFLKQAQQQLVGKTLYTKTALWEKYNETQMNSNLKMTPMRENTYKYCPVTVTRVENDYDDNYIILFRKDGQGEECAIGNIVFDYSRMSSSSNFIHSFTFENPKNQYPDISQEHWEGIMAQKVRKGFSPQEVKITFGETDEKTTEDDDETWYFYNRNKRDYAIEFKNGVVEKVRSQESRYY